MKEKIEKIINIIKNLFKNNKKPYFPKDVTYGENPDVYISGENSKTIKPPEPPHYIVLGENSKVIKPPEPPYYIVLGENSKVIKPPYVFENNTEEIRDENFKDSIKVNESELNKTIDRKENNNIVSSKETEKCD